MSNTPRRAPHNSSTDTVPSWRYMLWGRFMWLPEGLYYRLGDALVHLDGWRPLGYRERH